MREWRRWEWIPSIMEGDQKNPRWTALRCVTNRQVKNRGTDPFKFFSPKLAFDDGSVEGSHTYALPFAQCPDCGLKGAAGGLEYPWIDGKSVYDSKILRHLVWDKSGESTWAEYVEHANLLTLVACDFPIAPGTEFGPWNGKVLSSCEALVLGGFHTLLIDRKVVSVLAAEGMNFQTFEIELRPKKGYKPDLVEVWVPPVGLSCPSSGITLCPTCNRGSTKLAVCVNASTIPKEAHVFRLRDAPNALIFSRRFVELCEKHGLKGVTFVPVSHEYGAVQVPERIPVAPAAALLSVPTVIPTAKTGRASSVAKVPDGYFSAWLKNLQNFCERVRALEESVVELQSEPPASDADIRQLVRSLGKDIPGALSKFFLHAAKSVKFRYSVGTESGSLCISLKQVIAHLKEAQEWIEETWIAEDSKQKKIWSETLPFAQLENGDFLGLDLRGAKSNAKVIYLNHEDESFVLSPSFTSFLTEWERLCYVGPEHWILEPFLDDAGYLSGDGPRAEELRRSLLP